MAGPIARQFYLAPGHFANDMDFGLCLSSSNPRRLLVQVSYADEPLQEDVSKIEFKPSPDADDEDGYLFGSPLYLGWSSCGTFYDRSQLSAPVAAALPLCADCKGSGKYQGLGAPEDCRACGGKGRV